MPDREFVIPQLPHTPISGRDDSPWYPAVRRDYAGVLEKVRVGLQALIAAW